MCTGGIRLATELISQWQAHLDSSIDSRSSDREGTETVLCCLLSVAANASNVAFNLMDSLEHAQAPESTALGVVRPAVAAAEGIIRAAIAAAATTAAAMSMTLKDAVAQLLLAGHQDIRFDSAAVCASPATAHLSPSLTTVSSAEAAEASQQTAVTATTDLKGTADDSAVSSASAAVAASADGKHPSQADNLLFALLVTALKLVADGSDIRLMLRVGAVAGDLIQILSAILLSKTQRQKRCLQHYLQRCHGCCCPGGR